MEEKSNKDSEDQKKIVIFGIDGKYKIFNLVLWSKTGLKCNKTNINEVCSFEST